MTEHDQMTEKATKRVIDQIEDLDGMTFADLKDAVDEEMKRREKEFDRERRLELAEGDLLARRRKCESILGLSHDPAVNLDEGDSVPYASLTVYKGSDYLEIKDVDGKSQRLIKPEDLPDDPAERIEALQDNLDTLHYELLDEL